MNKIYDNWNSLLIITSKKINEPPPPEFINWYPTNKFQIPVALLGQNVHKRVQNFIYKKTQVIFEYISFP